MAKSDTTPMFTWLNGRAGVTVIANDSPTTVHFSADHAVCSRSSLMNELMKYDLWMQKKGPANSGTKEYKISQNVIAPW